MFMRVWMLLLLGGLSLAHPFPAQTVQTQGGRWGLLSPQGLERQLADKDFVLINTHIPYEGEIPGTDLFIPFNLIAKAGNLPKDKNAEIVVYCRSGRMSALSAQALVRLGYTNVRELKGGFEAWKAAGFALSIKPR
ncbi:rhodanese-like domain-containing protein [Calidithermus chliarophilus]|uniref:rhodanese-like domain-containing protein n=1 Tax=Calidithermus chliarophilus TaxID=52023 RepID=UPI000416A82F|nr:rhodanese-like domain-containing protein [Calidithermus chliarophilus]